MFTQWAETSNQKYPTFAPLKSAVYSESSSDLSLMYFGQKSYNKKLRSGAIISQGIYSLQDVSREHHLEPQVLAGVYVKNKIMR